MDDPIFMIDEAVIVCTKNRPDDLGRLLDSLAEQAGMDRRMILVVDASDLGPAKTTERIASAVDGISVEYMRYDRRPSLARQRNAGVEALPEEVAVVHFLDDDTTLAPGCLDTLSEGFSDPDVSGIGGKVVVPGRKIRKSTFLGRLFLLDSTSPGVVLTSGACVSGQVLAPDSCIETRWLGGCASYRREVFLSDQFDARLEAYSLDEDLDFSYRVGGRKKLIIVPSAIIYHHESNAERASRRDYARDHLIHRYWFLEKNMQHRLRKPAFWWSTVGRILAVSSRSDGKNDEVLAGLLAGARTVWKRAHPLLRPPPSGS